MSMYSVFVSEIFHIMFWTRVDQRLLKLRAGGRGPAICRMVPATRWLQHWLKESTGTPLRNPVQRGTKRGQEVSADVKAGGKLWNDQKTLGISRITMRSGAWSDEWLEVRFSEKVSLPWSTCPSHTLVKDVFHTCPLPASLAHQIHISPQSML